MSKRSKGGAVVVTSSDVGKICLTSFDCQATMAGDLVIESCELKPFWVECQPCLWNHYQDNDKDDYDKTNISVVNFELRLSLYKSHYLKSFVAFRDGSLNQLDSIKYFKSVTRYPKNIQMLY